MLKVEVMNLSPGRIVLRFYLMMAVVLLAGFTGIWLLGLLALPIFLSAILAVKVRLPITKTAKRVPLERQREAARPQASTPPSVRA
ncbi:MAG: hypothetical protein AAFW73_16380 [Bacteroidota bacterium]